MPERRPPSDDVTIEKAVKHLFPNEARQAAAFAHQRKRAAKAKQPAAAGSECDPRAKEVALRRLRGAADEELAVFEDRLRQDALAAGASEQELREAQARHPGHC